jgi:argininosuccinate lyase
MAQTVKTFPLRDYSEIKRKLFQMVNSIEMRIALMNLSFSEINNNRYNPDYHAQDSGDLPHDCSQSAP